MTGPSVKSLSQLYVLRKICNVLDVIKPKEKNNEASNSSFVRERLVFQKEKLRK